MVDEIIKELRSKGVSVKYDMDKKKRPGFKFAQYEMEGVPVRLAIGKRDLANGVIEVARRDTKEKKSVDLEGIADYVVQLLEDIQINLFDRAKKFRNDNTHKVDSWEEFFDVVSNGGFAYAHWDGTKETELKIKELTKATTRCIPLKPLPQFEDDGEGKCILTGKHSSQRILFARAY